MPPEQLWLLGQAMPHLLQFAGSLFVLVQVSSTPPLAGHFASPFVQAQLPFMQLPLMQWRKHMPQLSFDL
jgi:hypothetical protein